MPLPAHPFACLPASQPATLSTCLSFHRPSMQALNPPRPDCLTLQVIADELKLLKDKEEKASAAASLDAHNIEGRRFSVSELCHRFEKGMMVRRRAIDSIIIV